MKQLRRLHFAHGLSEPAASGSGSNEQTTAYDIKELNARISLPTGWYRDVLHRSAAAGGGRTVFYATRGYGEHGSAFSIIAIDDIADPPHSKDLDQRGPAYVRGLMDALRTKMRAKGAKVILTAYAIAVCFMAEKEQIGTYFLAYLVYGDRRLILQQFPPRDAAPEEAYAAFQRAVASLAFEEAEKLPSAAGWDASPKALIQALRADLDAAGFGGICFEHTPERMPKLDGIDNYAILYHGFDAAVQIIFWPDQKIRGLMIDFPYGLDYKADDGIRMFYDLQIIASACALFSGENHEVLSELVAKIHQNIMDEMAGASCKGIQRNGYIYYGSYLPARYNKEFGVALKESTHLNIVALPKADAASPQDKGGKPVQAKPAEEKPEEESPAANPSPNEAQGKMPEKRLGLMGWSLVLLIIAIILLASFFFLKNSSRGNTGTQSAAVTSTDKPQATDEPASVAEVAHADKADATGIPQVTDEPASVAEDMHTDKAEGADIDISQTTNAPASAEVAPIAPIPSAQTDSSPVSGTVYAIAALDATITLPAGWIPDEVIRSILSENRSEDDSARLVFLASTSDKESLLFVAVSETPQLSADYENLQAEAFFEKYQAILRDENHGTHITATQAADTAAICYAMEEPGRTAYMAMMVHGPSTLFIQLSPLPGGFDESGFAAFQGIVASIDFAAQPQPNASILETFQDNLETSGLKGVSIEYVEASETKGRAYVQVHRLRYGDYDAVVYLYRKQEGTLTGFVLYLPCGLAYRDEDDPRALQDLKVIESACALFDPSDRAELALRSYRDMLSGMDGAAPAEEILWNGRRYLGKYDAKMETAVLIIGLE